MPDRPFSYLLKAGFLFHCAYTRKDYSIYHRNIFVAILTFSPFFCAHTFDTAYCVCFKMICEMSL